MRRARLAAALVSAFLLVFCEPALGSAAAPGGAFVAGEAGENDAGPAAADVLLVVFMLVAAIGAVAALRRRGVLARGGLDVRRRDPAGLPAAVWLAWAAAGFFAMAVGGAIGAALSGGGPSLRAGAITNLCAMAAAGGAIAACVLLRRRAAEEAGFVAGPADALRGLGGLLVVFPIVWLVGLAGAQAAVWIALLRGVEPPTALAHTTLRELATSPRDVWWWATAALVVIAAPAVEEAVYRGFLQTAFVRAFGATWAAIAVSSVVFTLLHIGAADWQALPALFALSLGLGALYERTGRLGAAVAMHAGFNLINLALAMQSA